MDARAGARAPRRRRGSGPGCRRRGRRAGRGCCRLRRRAARRRRRATVDDAPARCRPGAGRSEVRREDEERLGRRGLRTAARLKELCRELGPRAPESSSPWLRHANFSSSRPSVPRRSRNRIVLRATRVSTCSSFDPLGGSAIANVRPSSRSRARGRTWSARTESSQPDETTEGAPRDLHRRARRTFASARRPSARTADRRADSEGVVCGREWTG